MQGLIKGPRPDFYQCETLVPVIILMMSNISLKVLVWDEYIECAKQLLLEAVEITRRVHPDLHEKLDSFLEKQQDGKIATFEIQVLGIRDVKGAEYDDIVILNFFSAKVEVGDGSGESWQSIPESCEKSWKLLAQSEDSAVVRQGISDLQIELQLKMLYTACSRCRCRLVFFETEKTKPSFNFFRKLRDLEFISPAADSSDIQYEQLEGKTRVLDDWACEAVLFSSMSLIYFAVCNIWLQVSIAQSIPDTHYRDRARAKELAGQVKHCLKKARLPSDCLEIIQCDA